MSVETNDENLDLFQVSEYVLKKVDGNTEGDPSSDPLMVFACVWTLEADVNNGGFDQYYLNSSGDFAASTPDALRTIGAPRFAEIVSAANAIFGASGPSSDRARRQDQRESLSEVQLDTLSDLDNQFYEYPEDLEGLLRAYVSEHRSAFQLEG